MRAYVLNGASKSTAFNSAVLKHVGVDHRSYEPIEAEKGRRLSTWQYQYEKANQALEIEKSLVDSTRLFLLKLFFDKTIFFLATCFLGFSAIAVI